PRRAPARGAVSDDSGGASAGRCGSEPALTHPARRAILRGELVRADTITSATWREHGDSASALVEFLRERGAAGLPHPGGRTLLAPGGPRPAEGRPRRWGRARSAERGRARRPAAAAHGQSGRAGSSRRWIARSLAGQAPRCRRAPDRQPPVILPPYLAELADLD